MRIEIFGGPKDGQVIEVPDHLRELVMPVIDTSLESVMELNGSVVELAPRTEVYPIKLRNNGRRYAVHPRLAR